MSDDPGRNAGSEAFSNPSQVRTREELGAALSALRVTAGLSIRDVVRAVPGLSLGTASGWFSGHHVPTRASEAVFALVLTELGAEADADAWRDAVERVRAAPGPRRAAPGRRGHRGRPVQSEKEEVPAPRTTVVEPDATGAPYVGLRSYARADSPLFRGREAEIGEILRRLDAGRSRPLVVVGASGSGKSSLLAAGVVPRWEERGLPVAIRRPGELDVASLAPGGALVVDQLEEVFSDDVPAARRTEVLEALERHAAAGAPTVVTLRADFFQAALEEPVLRAALDDEPVVLGPPSRACLTEIIVEPARDLGYTVEPALVSLLLDALAPSRAGLDRSPLPLLSHVLLVCWERSRRKRITVDDYVSTGGVEGAVRETAEAVHASLDARGREDSRSLFLRLVDVRSAHTVRRRAAHAELPEPLRAVAEPYAAAGLLMVDDEWITLTHEVVLTAWPRLADWIDADRDELRVLARLRSGAAEWEEADRSDSALPPASATADYVRWRAGGVHASQLHLETGEQEYVDAAARYHDRVARRDRNRIRALGALAASLAVVTVVALIAGLLALRATGQARETRDLALSRSGAVSALGLRERDPGLARSVALAAYRIAPTVEARSALLDTTRTDVPDRYEAGTGFGRAVPLPDGSGFVTASSDGSVRVTGFDTAEPASVIPLETGENSALRDLAVETSGRGVAVAGSTAVHLVDLAAPGGPRVVATLADGTGPYHSVRYSPDGRTLAAGAADGTVRRWDLAGVGGGDGGAEGDGVRVVGGVGDDDEGGLVPRDNSGESLPRIPGPEPATPIAGLAWTPDSSTLLATDGRPDVKVLTGAAAGDTPRWAEPLETGDEGYPLSVAVSPDGTRIAAGSTNREIRRWRTEGGRPDRAESLPPLRGWGAFVHDVSFDPEGRLAAAGSDERLRVYSPGWRPLADLPASQIAVSTRFLPDGGLLSYALDGIARRWHLEHLDGTTETDAVFQTASSADRTTAVLGLTAAAEHLTVVDTTGPTPRETARITPDPGSEFSASVAMSPDGRTVYAGTRDGGVQVHTAEFRPGRRSAGSLTATDGTVVGTALTADGRTLAACSDSAPELAVIDVTTPDRPRLRTTVDLPAPCFTVAAAESSPHVVVTMGGPDTVILDLTDPDRAAVATTLETGLGASPSAGYAHAAPLLATTGGDGMIRLWDVADPAAPRELSATPVPPGEIYWTAFSADDTRLLITSSTGQVTVLDVTDPAEPTRWAVLGATTDPILYQGREASPTGGLLAVGAAGTVTMWNLDVDRTITATCDAGLVLTQTEWERYFPDTEELDPCD